MPDQSTEDYLFQGMVVTPKREKETFKLFHEYLITRDIICVLCPSVILEKTIRIPRSLSVKASQVLKGFLNKVRTP